MLRDVPRDSNGSDPECLPTLGVLLPSTGWILKYSLLELWKGAFLALMEEELDREQNHRIISGVLLLQQSGSGAE